jgi:putative transposase
MSFRDDTRRSLWTPMHTSWNLWRYVHLNPVRVGLTATVGEWPWSGHHAYVGREVVPWLATEPVLAMFSSELSAAREAYVAFVDEGAIPPP